MIEVCRQRAERRRVSFMMMLILVTGMLAGLVFTGAWPAALCLLAFGAIILFGIPLLAQHTERARQASRRERGLYPSWPVKMPAQCLRSLGGSTRVRDDLAINGRLTCLPDRWQFEASPAAVKNLGTTPSVDWVRRAEPATESTFGLFRPGVLTFALDANHRIGVEANNVAEIAAEARAIPAK